MKMFVCRTCSTDSAMIDALRAGLPEATVEPVDCMSGCLHAQTVAFRAPGKVAYLFGEITTEDLPDLRTFLRLYESSPDGSFDDARVLGGLRSKAIARIPG